MANKGTNIEFTFGTLNLRGFRQVKKRKAIMRQGMTHCDLLLMQDTHLDAELGDTLTKDFRGDWQFNNRRNDSGGVAIYSKKHKLKQNDIHDFEDSNGSIIGRTVKIDDKTLYVISAYAPCCGDKTKNANNLQFLKRLEAVITDKRSHGVEVIICGDLNFIRDPVLDADGGNPTIHREQVAWIEHLEENLGIVDSFRFLRPEEKMSSWSRDGCFRRLDYVLLSKRLLERVTETAIIPVPSSDHRLLAVKLNLGRDPVAGPGIWRHNDSLLKDQEYIKTISDTIQEVKAGTFENGTAQWEYCKFRIKNASINFSKTRAREQRKEKKRMEAAYSMALYEGIDDENIAMLRKDLQKIYEEEDDAIRFRAGLDVIEKGEKISPFFFRTIQMNRDDSNISKLRTEAFPNGTTTKQETMDELENHFKRVFEDPEKEKEIPARWYDGIKKIPEDLKEKLDENIKLNDLTTVLFKFMVEGKSPGNDGLTTSFYRAFWAEISGLVMKSLNEGWEKQKFSDSQRQCIVRLIEKKGKDRETMSGWRPISLLNIDAKLWSKVLAERLKLVCKEVIGEEQLAYVSGNDIHEGHLLLNKVLEQARKKKVSGLLGCIDFKGAFDSVRHKFIFETLREMGLGDNFISMLKALYAENISAILNYGTTTRYIALERSCRQGDPVSAYLFILVMEILLNQMKKLKLGMKISTISLWSTAFADDLTMLLKSNAELRAVLRVLKDYKEISGLDINYTKSEILELNYKYDTSIGIPVKDNVKITGITFALDPDMMETKNWESVCSKVSSKLESWRGRNLSEVGKATVVKAQIAPIVLYTSTVMPLPKKYEKELMRMTYRFVGNGGEKESRALLCKKRCNGGLEIPNWRSRANSAMALWAVKASQSAKPYSRLFEEKGINWKSPSALATVRTEHGVEGFLGQCVTEYYKIAGLVASKESALIWPYVESETTAQLLKKKSPNLTFGQAEICIPHNLNFLEKRQVKLAIPKAEKTFERQCEAVVYEGRKELQKDLKCVKWPKPTYDPQGQKRPLGEGRIKTFEEKLKERLKSVNETYLNSLKALYWLKIDSIIPPPHPFRNRLEIKYGDIDWDKVDRSKSSTYSRMQSFDWRSSHGKLYANKNFKAMGLKDESKCTYCNEESQSISHLYLECRTTQNLFACFERKMKLTEKLTDLEKIIGMDPKVERGKLIRKKLGILRRLVYQCNHRDEKPRWEAFLDKVDVIYTFEYGIADRNGQILKHLLLWENKEF